MKRVVMAVMAACGAWAAHAEDIGVTYDANGDVTVAAGGEITVKTDALRDDGYVWYTVATWKPGREEYFWIGVGQFDKKVGAAVESVWVDEILIEEKE